MRASLSPTRELHDLAEEWRPRIEVELRRVEAASRLPLAAEALAGIEDLLYAAAIEPWIPSHAIQSGIRRVAEKERHLNPSPTPPLLVAHATHQAWLEGLAGQRLQATAINLAQAVHRTTSHLAELPVPHRRGTDAISAVRALGSETHNGGQRPTLIRFAGGQAVVYKPVSLEVDQRVSEGLIGLQARGGLGGLFGALRYLPAGPDYGFIEYAAAGPPLTSEAAARRYFFRFGALVATAYALNITDMHMENVIAIGERPLLIDLETSLYRFPDSVRPVDVTLSGLIQANSSTGQSHSGLQGGGHCRRWGLKWRTEGDQVTVRYRHDWYHATNRLRGPGGRLIDPARYAAHILAGFDAGYRLVQKERRWLLEHIEAGTGGSMRIRHILRFTSAYVLHMYRMLQASPRPMDNRMLELQGHLGTSGAAGDRVDPTVVGREIADLLCGDVPYFWTDFDSRDLNDHRGLVKSKFFDSSPLTTLQEQLARLSASDRRHQRRSLERAIC